MGVDEILDAWMDMMRIYPKWQGLSNWRENPMARDQNVMGDWEDRNGEIAVTMDMPGVDKKDIKIVVEPHSVSIEAVTDIRDYNVHKRFEQTLDPESVTATLNNGVLDMKISKEEMSKGRTIKIE
jgi:HSP20 family molecular chaperone IbpA